MKKILTASMIFIGLQCLSQTADDPLWVSLQVTNNKIYHNGLDGTLRFGQLDNAGFRLSATYYYDKNFDFSLGVSRGKLIYKQSYESNLTDADLRLIYKLNNGHILPESSNVAPFVGVGIGAVTFSQIEGAYPGLDGMNLNLPLVAGLKYKATPEANIVAMASYKKTLVNQPSYMQYSLGITFSIRGKRDTDGDGIYDKEDACVNEAGPADNGGCPYPDTDGDGVIDANDPCPTEAGALNGCPDGDGDGIADKDDACPNTVGLPAFDGCPDQDGDGVIDKDDDCPSTPGTLKGCPDSDGDGVADKDDQCPNAAGIAATNGCPDSDGDGVIDNQDRCPSTPGLVDNGGCPEVKEEVKKVLDLAVKNIQFNTGSDVLRRTSYASLNEVAQLMRDDDSFKLKLTGYTDNVGSEESNLQLSIDRAESVKAYLIGQGIDDSRLIADGRGIANPVADNSTREGRAANRRVELEIIFN